MAKVVFTSTPAGGTWTVPTGVTEVDVFLIAGGGGGGRDQWSDVRSAGGGGAGGYIFKKGFSVTAGQNLTVTVGTGGNGGNTGTDTTGGNGTNSVFDSLTAIGGGGGGGHHNSGPPYGAGANSGGSGGGGNNFDLPGASGTAGQGNDGGNGINDGSNFEGAGGGGAGAAGSNATAGTCGAGGVGIKEATDGSTYDLATLFGTDHGEVDGLFVYFGGGGGAVGTGTSSNGGFGGGGNGGGTNNGLANTGAGGGANRGTPGDGADGIVMIVYTDPFDPWEGQGNGEVTDDGGDTITRRGFVYDTSSYGDPGNVSPASSSYSDVVDESGSYGEVAFDLLMTGLQPDTTYYVRAFAENSAGFSYGAQESFTTTTTTSPTKVKVAGTFQEIAPQVKIGGTFVEKTPKIKQGGTFS